MKKSLHFLRKVAEDIWAIRERYFESSINYANLFFFQVRALLSILVLDMSLNISISREQQQIFCSTQGLASMRSPIDTKYKTRLIVS